MAKDRNGKYQPPKGNSSGPAGDESLGLNAPDPEKMDEGINITDRYATYEDELLRNVPVRHPNRHSEKGHDGFKSQQGAQNGRNADQSFAAEKKPSVEPQELPRILNKEQFAELANFKAGHCISIFLPTHASGVEVNEHSDVIAFKQALQELTAQLKNKGYNHLMIDHLLEPAHALVQDDAFWLKMEKGLALFIADGYCKYLKMPVAVEREIVMDNSFFVTPLIQLLASKEYFYLLVISKKQVKLFKADAFGMQHIPVQGLPEGMMDAQAADKDDVDDKQKIAAYFEAADDVIWKEILHTENVPLLLAGVEYLVPIYKSVSDYKHVCEEALTGSHERDDVHALYSQAREKMSSYFRQRFKKAAELYGNQSATALTSSIIDDIIPAAHYSQVSHLFVQKGTHIWGTFDEMANELRLHTAEGEGGEDLLDTAVVRTLLSGGDVFVVEKQEMPADSPLAAVLRY